MAHTAPVIVRGQVGQREARWDDARRSIFTYSEIQVTEVIKGRASSTLLVRQPGGVVGEIGARVEGVAAFREGEQVVLFLEAAPDEPSVFGVWSLAAGKVSLEKNKLGEVRAIRRLDGLAFSGGRAGAPKIQPVGGAEDLGTADAFITRLRKALSRRGEP